MPVRPALDPSVLARYSTDDFFYDDSGLERALDLAAICVRTG
jgi:hypothetical protein